MAFKLIEHVTGDLILGETHQVVVLLPLCRYTSAR